MAGFTSVAVAQQDPQFTQFMFNKLIFNPGYAGTSNAICGVLQFRQQWAGFTGSPQSFALAGDMRIPGMPVGVGLNVITDKVGPMSTFFLRGAGAFNMPLGKNGGTLGVGLDVGVIQKRISSTWITPEPLIGTDPRIPDPTNPDFNKLSLDLGFGVFYQMPKIFYVGVSTSHLPAQSLKDGGLGFKVKRHYYFTGGATIPVAGENGWLAVNPNVLYKTDFAGSALDLNLNLLWFKMFWVGGSYRLGDAGALLLGVQQNFQQFTFRGGYSFDIATGKLASYSKGSHEVMLGVCFAPKVKKQTSYSNDRYFE